MAPWLLWTLLDHPLALKTEGEGVWIPLSKTKNNQGYPVHRRSFGSSSILGAGGYVHHVRKCRKEIHLEFLAEVSSLVDVEFSKQGVVSH